MKDHRVLEELVLMHLRDDLEGEPKVTCARMHAAFVTALHNAIVDTSAAERPPCPPPKLRWKQRLSVNNVLFQAAILVALARVVLSRKGLII